MRKWPSQEMQWNQTRGRKVRPPALALVKEDELRDISYLAHSLNAEPTTSDFFMTKRPHSPDTPHAMQANGDAEPQEGREPKRRRSAPLPLDMNVALSLKPERNIDVVEDGDVLLVVNKFNDEEKP